MVADAFLQKPLGLYQDANPAAKNPMISTIKKLVVKNTINVANSINKENKPEYSRTFYLLSFNKDNFTDFIQKLYTKVFRDWGRAFDYIIFILKSIVLQSFLNPQ